MALTDTAIRKTKPTEKPFKLADSSGLYLLIKPNGSKLWYMKYRIDGKEKKLAFGPYPDVSLFKARQLRDAARAKIREGVDPSADKKIAQQKNKNGHTFRQIAMNWHGEHRRWSEHYANTIQRRLEMYVFPDIGGQPHRSYHHGNAVIYPAQSGKQGLSGESRAAEKLRHRDHALCGEKELIKSNRTMACSALSESGLWSKEAIEKQMSHQERNSVRAAYIHKAEYLEERIAMMQWWADYLDANTGGYISPYQFACRLKKVS